MYRLIMRAVAAAAFLCLQAYGQTIRIKGVVVDAKSGKPIAGALVRLAHAGFSDTTGTDGAFTLTDRSGVGISEPARGPSVSRGQSMAASAFVVDADRDQQAEFAFYDASGSLVLRRTRILSAGRNLVPRPHLAQGIFLLSVRTESGLSTLRFGNDGAGTPAEAAQAAPALMKASGAFSDTLIAAAAGYAPLRTPVISQVDSGLVLKADPIPAGSECGQAPADPLADSKARNLLCYLRTHSYISGQTDVGDADKVKSMTGRYPAIVAFDFMSYTSGQIRTQSVIDWAKSRKGIVAFQWHWNCPNGGNYAANCDFEPDLANTGSKLYKDIDLVARELKKMGDAGVPVIFRPLHESNNNYMWWAKKGPDAYKKLYKVIAARAKLAGAHGIIWVFNGMASGGGANTPMKNWYPGDDYVDIISGDYTQSQGDYGAMHAMGANKTIAISETMNQINPAGAAPFSFSVVWASRDWNGNSANDWKTAMANAKSISIDQLPDMSKW